MSSETITRNDLDAILNEILPIKYPVGTISGLDACLLKAENISIPVGTTDAVFEPTSRFILNGTTFSEGNGNRVVCNETCKVITIVSAVFSAISDTSSIKVVTLGRNGANNELAMAATGYPTTWTSLSAVDVVTLHSGDALHFTGRCQSGTNTLRQANIAVIRIG